MSEVAVRSPVQGLVDRITSDDFRQQIAKALPDGISLDRFERATATALLQNPDIAAIEDKASLFQAIIRSAQDGLVADGHEAAIVKFGKKAAYLPMIGGLRKVAAEYGWTLETAVVYANDAFDYELGLAPRLVHQPVRPGADRGERVAAYAVARHKATGPLFEVMTAEEIEKIRSTSRAANAGPWKDWPERMWEKTAGRRLFKKLPLGERERDRIARLVADDFESGEGAAVLYGQRRPELTQASPGGIQAESSVTVQSVDPGPDAAATPQDESATAGAAADVEPHEPGPDGTDGSEEPGPAHPIVDEGLQALADTAAAFNPKSTKWKGLTVGEIFASGDEGREWVAWCCKNAKRAELVKAVTDFARVYMPEAVDA